MSRVSLLLLAATVSICTSGCQNSPRLNPFMGYGPQRVAPPATGSLGTTEPYYPKASADGSASFSTPAPAIVSQASVGKHWVAPNGALVNRSTPNTAIGSGTLSNQVVVPSQFAQNQIARNQIAQTGFAPPPNTATTNTPTAGTATRIPSHLNPMRVNDATRTGYVAPVSPIELSLLPRPGQAVTANPIRGMHPSVLGLQQQPGAIGSGSAANVASLPSTSNSSGTALGWKRKYTPGSASDPTLR